MDHIVIRRSNNNLVAVCEGIKLGLSLAADSERELKIICSAFGQTATSSALRAAVGESIFECLKRNRQCKINGINTTLETIKTIKNSGAIFDGVCIFLWLSDSNVEKIICEVELCHLVILVEWLPGMLDNYIERNKAKLIEV